VPSDWIELKNLKISLKDLLKIVDKVIQERKGIKLPERFKKQGNNNITLLRWLAKQEVFELEYILDTKTVKPSTLRSRKRKIEIALQLRNLGQDFRYIGNLFNVKEATAKGYLKGISGLDGMFGDIMRFTLDSYGITLKTSLEEFLTFPIFIQYKKVEQEFAGKVNIDSLKKYIEDNKHLTLVTSKSLGSFDLVISVPI